MQEGFSTVPLYLAAWQDYSSKQDLLSWIPDLGLPLSTSNGGIGDVLYRHAATVDDQNNLHIELHCFGEVVSRNGQKFVAELNFQRLLPRSCAGANVSSFKDGDLVASTMTGNIKKSIVLRPERQASVSSREDEIICQVVGAANVALLDRDWPGELLRFCLV